MKQFQIIVIGAGSGGLVAAELAAKLGAQVALVEARPELGGDCLQAGCVPSKALIHAARTAWAAGHTAQALGVGAAVQVNFRHVMRHVGSAIQKITDNHDNDAYYEKLGISVIHGKAVFTGQQTIRVGQETFRAKRFIVASGSRAAIPNIVGLAGGEFLTNESIFQLESLPESLAVIGGGPIGCELGQALAMLGSRVTILQAGSNLLPRDEAEASAALLSSLKAMGITVRLNAQVEKVTYEINGSAKVYLKGGHSVKAAKLLVATGRRANMPEGLDQAAVATGSTGAIKVNGRLQTTNRRIYAIGDCNGGPQFTHIAARQAVIAVQNALLGLHKSFDASEIPWTTFTTPEIAHFGQTKSELDSSQVYYEIFRADFQNIDKAVAENEAGYVEILLSKKSRILGASVVGANAAEILAQIVVAKNWHKLTSVVQAYPTYASGLSQAAANFNLQHFCAGLPGKLTRRYINFRAK